MRLKSFIALFRDLRERWYMNYVDLCIFIVPFYIFLQAFTCRYIHTSYKKRIAKLGYSDVSLALDDLLILIRSISIEIPYTLRFAIRVTLRPRSFKRMNKRETVEIVSNRPSRRGAVMRRKSFEYHRSSHRRSLRMHVTTLRIHGHSRRLGKKSNGAPTRYWFQTRM